MPIAEDDPTVPLSPYGWSKLMTEMMLRDTAAAHPLRHVALRYFNVAGADPQLRTGLSTPAPRISSRSRSRQRSAAAAAIDVFGTDYADAGRHLHPRFHPRQRSGAARIVAALRYLRARRRQRHAQLRLRPRLFGARGARRGAPRRRPCRSRCTSASAAPGDIVVSVAAANRIREVLGWTPQFDDLDTIVGHALAWERHLMADRRAGPIQRAISA